MEAILIEAPGIPRELHWAHLDCLGSKTEWKVLAVDNTPIGRPCRFCGVPLNRSPIRPAA